jgi:ATP-dependent Lon protease
MSIALVSLFTGRPVRHEVAMTGEISLRGLVLPARNFRDLRDVSESTRTAIEFIPLETVDDAIRGALGEPEPQRKEPEPALA